MLQPVYVRSKFSLALPFEKYIASGTPDQQTSWQRNLDRVQLTPSQTQLLQSFTRQINILITSGLWCGDCAVQVPMLHRIAAAAPTLNLRILDRDVHIDLSEQVKICGGLRVPTVIFLNEDFEFLGLMGDRSLSRLRAMAQRQIGGGAFCELPTAQPPQDTLAATLSDWLAECERIHLLARLSPKLRERHAD